VALKGVFQYDAGPALKARLEDLSGQGLEIVACGEREVARFATLMRDADVLWHVLKPVTASVIENAPRLRLIQKVGVGVNTIDLEAARRCGVAVCNMPGTNSQAVAEMTLALMLGTLRRLSFFDGATRRGGGWSWDASVQDGLGEVCGKTVGLVGYGAVPSRLAPVLIAMGARVLYWARGPKTDAVGEWRPLARLLSESDVVSLHVPLDDKTERLIDAAAIARMKPDAVLINTARGGLVDETALAAALREGRLRGAGLDVFVREPVAADNPLLALENVIVAPHVAWLTMETLGRSIEVAAENCRRLEAGEDLLHRVA
jgi:phosphoglycerate dehydrogenase-like enzyme